MASHIAAVVVLTFAFLVAGINGYAATLVVTKTADTADGICDADCSLREAVVAAASGDTIVFSPLFNEPQTITLVSGQLAITRNLTIAGPGAGTLAISGNNAGRILHITGGPSVSLLGLTLRDGRLTALDSFGGAIYMLNSTLNLTDMILTNNYVRYSGTNPPLLYGYGGAIYCSQSSVTVTTSAITNNEGLNGAGITTTNGNITVVNSVISNNIGSGIVSQDIDIVTIINSTFDNNTSLALVSNAGDISMSRSMITNNGNGGILMGFSNSRLTLDDSIISNNSRLASPGLDGGGIDNRGLAFIHDCTIKNNRVSGRGGGIRNSGTLYVSRTSILNNEGQGSGGGVFNVIGHLYLTNSTVSGNQAGSTGGGIHNYADAVNNNGRLTLTNVTIAFNQAASAGGGLRQETSSGAITTRNSILAKNTSSGGQPDVSGAVVSQGYNLVGSTVGSTGWLSSDLLTLDPMLAPLGNNGGPTWTHALRPMSPAIDAGNNELSRDPITGLLLNDDQRGFGRPIGLAVDIGSHESNIATSPVRIRGRVLTSDGRGIGRALLSLTTESGVTVYAISNPFGYYRFLNLPSGTTYVFTVNHKFYGFGPPQTITVEQNLNDFDLIGLL